MVFRELTEHWSLIHVEIPKWGRIHSCKAIQAATTPRMMRISTDCSFLTAPPWGCPGKEINHRYSHCCAKAGDRQAANRSHGTRVRRAHGPPRPAILRRVAPRHPGSSFVEALEIAMWPTVDNRKCGWIGSIRGAKLAGVSTARCATSGPRTCSGTASHFQGMNHASAALSRSGLDPRPTTTGSLPFPAPRPGRRTLSHSPLDRRPLILSFLASMTRSIDSTTSTTLRCWS